MWIYWARLITWSHRKRFFSCICSKFVLNGYPMLIPGYPLFLYKSGTRLHDNALPWIHKQGFKAQYSWLFSKSKKILWEHRLVTRPKGVVILLRILVLKFGTRSPMSSEQEKIFLLLKGYWDTGTVFPVNAPHVDSNLPITCTPILIHHFIEYQISHARSTASCILLFIIYLNVF